MLGATIESKERLFQIFLLFSLFFLFLIDGVSKYTRIYHGFIVSTPFRFLVLAVVVLFLLYSRSIFLKARNKLFLFLLFFCSILVGNVCTGIWGDASYYELFYLFLRYAAGLIFIIGASSVRPQLNFSKAFHFVFFINGCISLIGYFFDIRAFRTYGHIENATEGWVDDRFGFNGLLLEQNISSYFYAVALVNAYFLYRRNDISIIHFLICIMMSFLVGTKTLLVFAIFFGLSILIKGTNARLAFMSIFIFAGFFFFLSNDNPFKYITFQTLNVVTSFRLENFFERLYPKLIHMDFFESAFGIQCVNYKDCLVEFEFVDLFAFSGWFGSFIYLLIFFISCRVFTKVENGFAILLMFILLAAFSGHLFYDPTSMLYFSFLLIILNENAQLKKSA